MKIIYAVVTSVDGKTTKGSSSPKDWASSEDQDFFSAIFKENNLIMMGRKTFDGSPIKPNPTKLKIILTKHPEKYSHLQVEGQLEFSNKSPKQMIPNLEKKGFNQLLFLGGAESANAFFRDSLIDELWLTLEPKIFGEGNGLVNQTLEVNLKLKNIRKLNAQGTLLLKYQVL